MQSHLGADLVHTKNSIDVDLSVNLVLACPPPFPSASSLRPAHSHPRAFFCSACSVARSFALWITRNNMSSHDKELPMISSIIVLANEGKRIASRYYQNACPDLKSQLAFEKKLYQKTHRTNARSDAEVVLFEKYIVVYKYIADVFFYVCAPSEENELVVLSVLNCLEDSLQTLLQYVWRPSITHNRRLSIHNIMVQ